MILTVIIIIIFSIIAIFVTSRLLIKKLMIPNAKDLDEEEVKICEQIVKSRKGYPYVCKWAVKHKKCPCLPCKKLESNRNNLSK